jgi:hypothetical protein
MVSEVGVDWRNQLDWVNKIDKDKMEPLEHSGINHSEDQP